MARQKPLPNIRDIDPLKRIIIDDFASVASFKDNELVNFRFEQRSTSSGKNIYIKKRKGTVIKGNDVGNYTGRGLFAYNKTNGTRSLYAAWDGASNSDIYILSGSTWTAQSLSLTNGKEFDYEQDGDVMYWTNGTDAIQKYDGSSWSVLSGGTPMSGAGNIAKYIKRINRMMFYANSANNPNRLWISNLAASETVSNNYDFPDEITGMIPFGQFMIVGTSKAVYRVLALAPSTAQIKRIDYIPVASHRSMAQVGDLIFFCGKDRIYATDGGIVKSVSWESLEDIWNTSVNKNQIQNTAGIFHKGVYHLSFASGSSSTQDETLIYDPRFGVWVLDDGYNAKIWAEFESDTTQPSLFFLEATADSKVFEMYSSFKDNGTAVDWKYTTKELDIGEPNFIKKFKKIYVNLKAIGSAETKVYKNIDDYGFGLIAFGASQHNFIDMTASGSLWGTAIWGSFTWGASNLVVSPENRGKLTDKGKKIQIRSGDNQTVGQTEIYDYQLFFIPQRIK